MESVHFFVILFTLHSLLTLLGISLSFVIILHIFVWAAQISMVYEAACVLAPDRSMCVYNDKNALPKWIARVHTSNVHG